VASNGGGDPPGWFLNLQDDPIVAVQQSNVRLAIGQPQRRVADPFRPRRIDRREDLRRRRPNIGDERRIAG